MRRLTCWKLQPEEMSSDSDLCATFGGVVCDSHSLAHVPQRTTVAYAVTRLKVMKRRGGGR